MLNQPLANLSALDATICSLILSTATVQFQYLPDDVLSQSILGAPIDRAKGSWRQKEVSNHCSEATIQ